MSPARSWSWPRGKTSSGTHPDEVAGVGPGEAWRVTLAQQDRVGVTAARVRQASARDVENAAKHGQKRLRRVLLRELIVQPRQHLARLVDLPGDRAKRRRGHRHEHRRGNALAGNVAGDDADAARPEREGIVEITADPACGEERGRDLDRRIADDAARSWKARCPSGSGGRCACRSRAAPPRPRPESPSRCGA